MKGQLIVAKARLRLIIREYYAGKLRKDEALDLVIECIDAYTSGKPIELPAEEFFPAWCETWRQSHGEPELPRLESSRRREALS